MDAQEREIKAHYDALAFRPSKAAPWKAEFRALFEACDRLINMGGLDERYEFASALARARKFPESQP